MTDISVLQKLIDDGAAGRTLKKGADAPAAIRSLQEALYATGYGKALSWDRFGPDGDYGNATTTAVKAFGKANRIDTDGTSVSAELARKLVQRYEFLDEMHHMQDAVKSPTILKQLHFKSPNRVAVMVLQRILYEHGFGEEMKWEKYGNDGEYGNGTRAAVIAFGRKHNIDTDGERVTEQMAKLSLDAFLPFYGPDWYAETPKIVLQSLTVTATSKYFTVSDGIDKKAFRRFKRGVYTVGDRKTITFIDSHRAELKSKGMSDSALNVMIGVSENEGNLDAINTWDNAFMTFGMFQWTIGTGSAKGELPALFKKIKASEPEAWDEFYTPHGLDVWPKTDEIYGHLMLNGQIVNTPSEKSQFRDARWCFRFWKAGQDPRVQAVSLRHAYERIGTFHRNPGFRVEGHDIADIITSEYGMALVLDNHVNRPGYIKACIGRAMERAGLSGSNPKNWDTADERKLISHYLNIRETYGRSPMTHAAGRARVTKKYLTRGVISDERGSFRF